nr:phage lysin [uncultured bacterium]
MLGRAVAIVAVLGLGYYAWVQYASADEAPAPVVGADITDPTTWGAYTDDIADAVYDLGQEVGLSQVDQSTLQNLDMNTNVRALLETIKLCEGTKNAGEYSCLYGSTPSNPRTFAGFADHPRIVSRISASDQRWTSAAGAYQMMAVSPIPGGGSTRVNTWDTLKARLGLPDFSPASQDAAAIELLRECGALGRLQVGDLAGAVSRARGIWASLPGANYAGQGMRSMDQVAQWFAANGGVTA